MKSSLPIERQQSHIRRGVAHLQFAVAPLRQRVAQKPIDVAWPAHHVTERPVPARQNCNQNYGRPLPPTHQFTFLPTSFRSSFGSSCGSFDDNLAKNRSQPPP